jgi:hypothetical protein
MKVFQTWTVAESIIVIPITVTGARGLTLERRQRTSPSSGETDGDCETAADLAAVLV